MSDLNTLNTSDANALLESEVVSISRPDLEKNYVAPSTEIEQQLTELWQEFFGIEKIGIGDDFFDLGGDSLKALTIAKKIHKQFDVDINLADFFDMSTVQLLAKEIELVTSLAELSIDTNSGENLNEIKI
jgi:acyl carrier protein